MAWMDTTMLLRFWGISEPSAATKHKRNCRARGEGELLRFESAAGESYERAVAGERSVNVPSIPCVTVTMLNASILVRLSCSFLTKIEKGVCEPASTFDLRK